MKKILLTLISLPLIGFGQNKEVKINYTNGTEVFEVLTNKNPNISFDEEKEYFWYTEFTNIKTTKGGSGGLLLNGNYKFYNESGNLENEINYKLGLKHGVQKNWDADGTVILNNEYIEGRAVYTKFRNDQGIFISWENPIDPFSIQQSKGAIKKQFDKYNQLEMVIKYHDLALTQMTEYYTYSNQKDKEYFKAGFGGGPLYGKYTKWYSDGQVKVDGQYYEPEEFSMGGMICYECDPEIRVGTWTWYNEDGTIDSQSTYKADISYWDNGSIKSVGGLIKSGGEWLKHGKWIFHDEEESWEKEEKKYEWGNEVVID
jgi:antitoxin component YwqK of YwqJK toxin-antitoxin module